MRYIIQCNFIIIFLSKNRCHFQTQKKLFLNVRHLSYFCSQGPGYPGPYPHYSESGHALPPNPPYPTGQSLHPSQQADAWAHSGPYVPSQQPWPPGQQPPQNHYGNPVRPPHPPAWPGTGTGAPPPYQPKVRILRDFLFYFCETQMCTQCITTVMMNCHYTLFSVITHLFWVDSICFWRD